MQRNLYKDFPASKIKKLVADIELLAIELEDLKHKKTPMAYKINNARSIGKNELLAACAA
jgi:FtsZ-binding cell division protein ZapB